MKSLTKVLVTMGLVAMLAVGCSQETTEDEVENKTPEAAMTNESDDPMEVGNKNSEFDTMVDGEMEYKVIDFYATDNTDENGFNTIDFDGYLFTYSLALVEDQDGEFSVAMFGESENTTSETVHFNAGIEIVTDTQDQTETQQGFGESKPNVKLKGYDLLPLEYGKPESFTATIYPPMTEIAEDEYEDFDIEPIELEFTKE